MKYINALIGTSFKRPEHSNGGVRLLYVAPFVNSKGYYRMILPYLELSGYGFETKVTSISKWDFNKSYTIGEDSISEEDIRWADYIIFSTLLMDYSYLLSAIKILNPKVQLVMDIPEFITDNPKIKAHQESFRRNLSTIDIITTPNISERSELLALGNANTTGTKQIECHWLPSLISKIGYKGLRSPLKKEKDKIRIGMIGSSLQTPEYLACLQLIQNIKAIYGSKVEWLLFGWDGKTKDGYRPLSAAAITYIKPVSFLDYFEKLQSLDFDILFIPSSYKKKFSLYNTIIAKEAAVFGIPTIAPIQSNYEHHIMPDTNGILATSMKDCQAKLRYYIDTPEYRKRLRQTTRQGIWLSDGYTEDNLFFYQNVFR